ncbi:hypothetical protein NX059_006007 [Plenodomus lindquistii]|nr:hypothetical protein NX059_006007 [Plenodomus lindquistii]
MAYATEDELDWSDGTIYTPAPVCHKPATAYMYPSVIKADDEYYNSLFDSDSSEDQPEQDSPHEELPADLCVLPDNDQYTSPVTHANTEPGSHDHRRVPSKEDYVNFALYQADQKAYEATLFKQFVAHALHPDQIKQCFTGNGSSHVKLQQYLNLINANVDKMAEKMIWNAHHRAIHMLATEGRTDATFLHVHELDEGSFADFGPGSTSSRVAVSNISESWHRAFADPVTVCLSTTQYPLARHTHPLDDVDDRAKTATSNDEPPIPHNTEALVEDTQRCQGMPVAVPSLDQAATDSHVDHEMPIPATSAKAHRDIPGYQGGFMAVDILMPDAPPTLLEGLQEAHPAHEHQDLTSFANMPAYPHSHYAAPTQLEMLFGKHGAEALASDWPQSDTGSDTTSAIVKVPSWSQKLLNDHKRRLTERWGNLRQTLDTLLPGIEEVISQSMANGCRPTDPDWRDKARELDAREQDHISTRIVPVMELVPTIPKESRRGRQKPSNTDAVPRILTTSIFTEPMGAPLPSARPAKKRKVDKKPGVVSSRNKQRAVKPNKSSGASAKSSAPPTAATDASLPPHPSGSKTLELDQHLPPDAYFEPRTPDDKPAWRCSIKHALGHYYNAGDRKACRGCNTSLIDIPNAKLMDFYLPRRTFSNQPAPNMRWKPGKPPGKIPKLANQCHNSVAKYAFWAAISTGHTEDAARDIGRATLLAHLAPKPRKEPTPPPVPAPKPDPGPHPSGSDTMEHGQDLPDCAYWKRQQRHEDPAWRCDVSHALGRYYLAGDKKSCPGCGTNKGGAGRQTVMDFFLPPGTIIRQEAPNIVKWKPRKYKGRAGAGASVKEGKEKGKHLTHNQACSEKYFRAKTEGLGHAVALERAVRQTDEWLDGKMGEKFVEQEDGDEVKEDAHSLADNDGMSDTAPDVEAEAEACTANHRGGCTVSLVPAKRSSDEFDDDGGGGDYGDTDSVLGAADSLFGDDEEGDMVGLPAYGEVFGGEGESESESKSERSDSEY